MKRKLIAIISIMLVACMLFTACDDEITTTDEATTDTVTEAPADNNGGNDSHEQDTEPASEEETTEEQTTEEQNEIIGTVVGYTSKGYVISEKDGITYVDGVLVANKTYSLPADYNPGDLLPECEAAFSKMQSDAAAENLEIWNASGFRSYELQQSLYNRYSDRDGKEAADRYSARPGHSEHQTGLAIDLNEISSSFANTDEGKWIAENCHKYGFILRYMQNKEAQTGYMYEPWHIRYVGVSVATDIYNSGLCLEEYYGITSSYADTAEKPEEITSEEPLSEDVVIEAETSTEAVAEETTAATEETTAAAEETTAESIVG